ncbi:MAG: 3-hydroxyacyl-ACP dehydratase FabZ [Proteobacteria bacterium]|nr:MAG: 3-hydroxyacyl-ACP dehydratase FabZ [Pseudomonadota bacterium]
MQENQAPQNSAAKGDAKKAPPLYTANDILKLLPHRFPFLLVDRVESLVRPAGPSRVGRKIRAIKNVTINEPFFPGHFPHRPVMPGVLQIEVLAQAAALGCADLEGPKMDVAIAGVNNARFRKPVVPGDTLEVTAEVIKDRSGLLIVKCEARVDGDIVCEAELIAKVFVLEEQ